MSTRTIIGVLLLTAVTMAQAAPATNPTTKPATNPINVPQRPLRPVRAAPARINAPPQAPALDDPRAKQLMQDVLTALNDSPELVVNASLDRLDTPNPNVNNPNVVASHTHEQITFARHGSKALKLTTADGQHNAQLLFDGSVARILDNPKSGSWWTPQILDADWVISHSPDLPGRDSPLAYIFSLSGRDRLLRRATAWRFLGPATEDFDQAGPFDRIDFRYRDTSWEAWITRDKPQRIHRLIYNGYTLFTYPVPADPKTNTPASMATIRINRREEWTFSSWDAAPTFAPDAFQYVDAGQPLNDISDAVDPPLLHPGTPAPDFELTNLDGKTIKLSEQIGSIVVLEFWANRSRISTRDLPITRQSVAKYADQGILFLSISPDEPGTVQQTLAQNNLTGLPVLHDLRNEIRRAYLAGGFPYIIIIARDGSVFRVLRQLDDTYEPDLSSNLDAALTAETH